jgi:hypothetical protein
MNVINIKFLEIKMTFEEWWDSSPARNTPETYHGWEASCRNAFHAGKGSIDFYSLVDLIHCHTDAPKQDAKEIVRLFMNRQASVCIPEP